MIVWVFGGTAVGKKHFIAAACADPCAFGLPAGIRAVWVEDGEKDPEELIAAARGSSLLVRWQWGREAHMDYMRALTPDITHQLCMVKVDRHVQVARVIRREGLLKWTEWQLDREAEDIQHLAETLSMRHGIAVRYIDGCL